MTLVVDRLVGRMGRVDSEIDRRLADPVVSCLFFGGVFLAGVVVNLLRLALRLLMWRGAVEGEFGAHFGDLARLCAVLLILALGAGLSSVVLRRYVFRRSDLATRNLASGICAGLVYSGACIVLFGQGMGYWGLGLGAAVFAGVTWAFTSGLNAV